MLLPWPKAADDHQRKNAEVFAAAGAAGLLDGRDVKVRLDNAIAEQLALIIRDSARRKQMAAAMQSLARPNAAWHIASMINQIAFREAIETLAEPPSNLALYGTASVPFRHCPVLCIPATFVSPHFRNATDPLAGPKGAPPRRSLRFAMLAKKSRNSSNLVDLFLRFDIRYGQLSLPAVMPRPSRPAACLERSEVFHQRRIEPC